MILQPISNIKPLAELTQKNMTIGVNSGSQIPFKSLFEDAMNSVKESDANLSTEIQKVATGQTDDLHSVNIASTKASLALEMFVQLRNKALESYNSIMQMGV
ncbi:flagellar hook-basal body complex protein FliE [Paludicola sp. MB14-C6]|uniref:flagellar hook-basal body complex protein FliE n=1 Tax=Paludihabitans sp. MB14-C6 TaxID=3070656 RepID=UPI0027DDBB24|nr:flagellar hook-basal body complex protein FliE [Paludicola sp. MB14-C6]WMJ24252.1 flagellar hook-basal body complex protein FliE [Paludicola sp. MB14-C6]